MTMLSTTVITATTSTIACSRNRSLRCTACRASSPVPGHANTLSTRMVEPASMRIISHPATVTMDTEAFRSAWTATVRRTGIPFARATLIHGRFNSSIIEDLVSMVSLPAEGRASVSDGSIRCFQSPVPDVGSHRSHTANMRMNIRPSQKPGIESPNRLDVVATRSRAAFGFNAAIVPSGIAMRSAISMPSAVSLIVFGRRSATIFKAERCCQRELPKSPRMACEA